MSLRPVFYPSDGKLLYEGIHAGANLTTSRHSERKKGVGKWGTSPDTCFFAARVHGEVFSYKACCILQIGAGARVDDGNVE